MKSKPNSDGVGCAILIGFAAVSIGLGFLAGAGFGWLMFGGLMLLLAGASRS